MAVSALMFAFAAILTALIVLDRRGGRRLPFPWLWTLPSVLLIGLGVLTGAARYPSLPNELPNHFDVHGQADGFVATTPFHALLPVILQILVSAVLVAAVALMLRTPYAGEPAPAETMRRRERAVALHAHALLVLAASIDLALFLIAQPIWLGRTTLPLGAMIGAGVSVAAGLAAVAVAAVISGRHGPQNGWRAGRVVLVAVLGVPVLTAFLGHLAA